MLIKISSHVDAHRHSLSKVLRYKLDLFPCTMSQGILADLPCTPAHGASTVQYHPPTILDQPHITL